MREAFKLEYMKTSKSNHEQLAIVLTKIGTVRSIPASNCQHNLKSATLIHAASC